MTTYLELQEQIKKLQQQAEELKKTEIEGVITEIKTKIQQYELTAEQLGFTASASKTPSKKASSSEPVVMYKNEEGKTWSGAKQGRKPNWVLQLEASGGDVEKYRIKK